MRTAQLFSKEFQRGDDVSTPHLLCAIADPARSVRGVLESLNLNTYFLEHSFALIDNGRSLRMVQVLQLIEFALQHDKKLRT